MTDPSDMQMNASTYENFSNGYLIQKALAEDVVDLVEKARVMFLDAFGEAYKNEPSFKKYVAEAFTLEKFEEEWKDPHTQFWIMKEGPNWVGYAKTRIDILPGCIPSGRGFEIKRFYLNRKYHGKGLAQELMAFCLELARKELCDTVWLGVWPQNTKAIKFYQKHGFEFCGEIQFNLGDKIEWDLVMKKDIAID